MHRLQVDSTSSTSMDRLSRRLEVGFLEWGKFSRACDSSILVPEKYEPNYAYPLLVWLFGEDQKADFIRQVMPHVSLRNYVGVGVRPLGDPSSHSQVLELPRCSEAEAVLEAIEDTSRRYHIDRRRIFVMGVGQNGASAMRVALDLPEVFAGAVSIGGPFPKGGAPLARIRSMGALKLMFMHSSESESYSTGDLLNDLRIMHAASLRVEITCYTGADELTTKMLSDLNRWVMEIVNGCDTDVS